MRDSDSFFENESESDGERGLGLKVCSHVVPVNADHGRGLGAVPFYGVFPVLKRRKPRLGRTGLSGGKHGSGDRRASEVCLRHSQKGSKQQRRLSGVYSLGGAAVELDMQFPSEGVSAQPAKRFNDSSG